MEGYVHDRLYGRIPYSASEARLLQTTEVAHLHDVSLSAVPAWTIPTGTPASKFEHCLGTAYLSRLLAQKREFRHVALELFASSLAHDIATPPFSHLSEHHLRVLFGQTHEDFAEEVLANSEFSRELRRQGADVALVLQLLQGKCPPLSQVVNGSIDLDNLDNTLRYGASMGILGPEDIRIYRPEQIAQGFGIKDNALFLEADVGEAVQRWAECRGIVYEYVYSPRNLAPGTMVSRAIELAHRAGQIQKSFFRLTDSQAYRYLEEDCNSDTQLLMNNARHWRWHECIFEHQTSTPGEKEKALFEKKEDRQTLPDSIARLLKVGDAEVTVYFGQNKGFKELDVPFRPKDVAWEPPVIHAPKAMRCPVWNAQVYVDPRLNTPATERVVREFMNAQLGL